MYAMNTDPATWPDVAAERREQAENKYINSGDQLVTDALEWACGHAHEHAQLVDMIVDYYVESPQFATMVEDIADGEVEL